MCTKENGPNGNVLCTDAKVLIANCKEAIIHSSYLRTYSVLVSNSVVTFCDAKCKRKDKYDVWMDLWVRKHSSQSIEVISVCSGPAGSTQLACERVLLVCNVVCTLMSTFFWLLVLARMKVTFFFIVIKQRKQPKYHLVLIVQIFGIEPPLSLVRSQTTHELGANSYHYH